MDTNGLPYDGSYGLKLRLYTNATTGSYFYENSNKVEFVDGYYTATLGVNTTYGSLSNALVSGETYVEAIVEGITAEPREHLFPVAYALLSGGVTTNAITAAMIAPAAVQSSHLASGAVQSGSIAAGAVGVAEVNTSELDARYVNVTGDTMTGPLSVGMLTNVNMIDFAGDNVSIGRNAASCGVGAGGTAVGSGSCGYQGVAIGYGANGFAGVAVGRLANGSECGVAIGGGAIGCSWGTAVGLTAAGTNGGTAVGAYSKASVCGVALGVYANGSQTNIAIGYKAQTRGGGRRIAIGVETTNDIDNTAVIRGSLYLDGATGIYYRAQFGAGAWEWQATPHIIVTGNVDVT